MGITFLDFLRERFDSEQVALKPGRLINVMRLVWQVRRERNQLAALSREQLADLGIHPGDAEREVKRDLFDLPKSRLGKL